MKKIIFLISVIFVFVSCNKIDNATQNQSLIKGKKVGHAIKEILPLSSNVKKYTKTMIDKIEKKNYIPNYDESFMVTYDSLEIVAVYTPLTDMLKTNNETYHICYVMDSLYSDFALLLHKEQVDDDLVKYYYNTIDDENIGQIVFTQEGIINEVIVMAPGWGGRFENCVNWVLDQMNYLDYLACMALGPACAGTISLMCAIGATEGYFGED
jgi:hypothetical protein